MAEMPGPISTSICHACGQMSGDCCDIRPAPEPTQALTFGSTGLLTALEVTDLEVVAPLAPAVLPPCSALADAFRLHNLGRYTLFSSLLL